MARDEGGRGISRRTLLIGGGAGVGLLVAWRLWPRSYAPNLRAAEGETVYNAWLKIARDGRVIVAVPQAELGQGVYTSLPQILADELGADWRTVSVEPAPISPLYANRALAGEAGFLERVTRSADVREGLMLTLGSTSVRAFEAPLREAGAGARALLQMAAANRWDVNWEELDTREGFIWGPEARIAFAELAEEAAGLELPDNLPIRGGIDNRLTGQPLPRLDAPSKLDGSARFAGDIRLDDMVFAAVRSGPPGSRLAGIDKAGAERVPGTLKIVRNPEWVAAVATNWWAAAKALDALNPRFSVPEGLPDSRAIRVALNNALSSGGATRVHESGDMNSGFPGASPIEARYEAGLGPSAAIEPLTATAKVTGDRLELWAPAQAPGLARAAAARALGWAESQVTLYPTLAGGGYGRKLEHDAIEQAAILALHLGRPVQVAWPRVQEIERDAFRPAAAAKMTGWLQQGRLMGWQALIAAPEAGEEWAGRIGADAGLIGADAGPAAGAVPPYDIPAVAIDHVPAALGVPTGYGRGGAHGYTCFFTESFIDELGRTAGLEVLAFRNTMLVGNQRLARCLATAASIGGWDGGPPGSGMGLACHAAFGSYIAALVEVEVTGDQRLRAVRAVVAVDCGRVINPEIVKQQIEGGLIHGIAAATGAPIGIAGGTPTLRHIGEYGLPTLRDAPEVSVELLESEEAPGGVTELAVPVAAPAVANAYFSLTGQRARSLPIQVGRRG